MGLVRISKRHGDVRRTGRWVVPQRMEIRVEAGDVKLDFTEAVVVDADDVEVIWDDVKVGEVTGPHEPIVLRVKATGRAP